MKFYECSKCGQVILSFNGPNSPLNCCGEEMVLVTPQEEKNENTPVIRKIGNFVTVYVGDEHHPNLIVHGILFLILETDKNIYAKRFNGNEKSVAKFILNNDENIVSCYSYCSLHGLYESKEII